MQEKPRRLRYLVPAVLATLAVIVVVGAFEFANPPITNGSKTTGLSASAEVGAAWSDHIAKFEAMNVTTMESDYTPNASASFVSLGHGDYYSPNTVNTTITDNATTPEHIIRMFQGALLSDFVVPKIYNVNTTVDVKGDTALLTSNFIIQGTNFDMTNLIASVTCKVTYVEVGGQWLISYEVWTLNSVNSH